MTFCSVRPQSGAIMAVLAAVCTKMPEAKLAIIFLPMFTFTAANVRFSTPVRDTYTRTHKLNKFYTTWMILALFDFKVSQ